MQKLIRGKLVVVHNPVAPEVPSDRGPCDVERLSIDEATVEAIESEIEP
jgi:hypothetical protein